MLTTKHKKKKNHLFIESKLLDEYETGIINLIKIYHCFKFLFFISDDSIKKSFKKKERNDLLTWSPFSPFPPRFPRLPLGP